MIFPSKWCHASTHAEIPNFKNTQTHTSLIVVFNGDTQVDVNVTPLKLCYWVTLGHTGAPIRISSFPYFQLQMEIVAKLRNNSRWIRSEIEYQPHKQQMFV